MSNASKEKKLVTDVWTLRSFPHYGNSCFTLISIFVCMHIFTHEREQPMVKNVTGFFTNHPCVISGNVSDEVTSLPHPGRCHWFYNCSAQLPDASSGSYPGVVQADGEGWDALTEECPYPTLFSVASRSCQHYSQVECGTRPLYLDPCQ
jgi:hypothetical protein